MVTNNTIVNLFDEMADLLEIKGENKFKIRAYRMASSKIRDMSIEVENIKSKKELMKIDGIGDAISDKIIEIIQTGDFKLHAEILQDIPKDLLEFLNIEGLGHKRIGFLHKKLNIKNIEDLKKASLSGELETLEGFGAKIKEKILKGIENISINKGRFLLDEVLPISKDIISIMKKVKGVKNVEVAGSLRRCKESVKDLDIIITGEKFIGSKVMDTFVSYKRIKEIIQRGETKSSIKLDNDLQVDLRFIEPDCFGSSMQYFTGSKEHNVALRTYAKDKGFKTSEYGLFKVSKKFEKWVAGKTEKEFYNALGMDFIEPELRENTGELAAALENKLPKLIKLSDIKGDLQMHTTQSDGANTLEEMAEAAIKLNYEYIAITEHSKSVYIANGLDELRLEKWIDIVNKVNEKYNKITILAGIEVDILKDGSLDLKDDVLKKCNIVVASIHSHFKMDSDSMTKRISDALSNPLVNILAHPTARKVNRREPMQFDFEKIVEVAVKNNVALEINSAPRRLDLKDRLARRVIEKGGKLSINTDAHSIKDLDWMELGVGTARRAWCKKRDCINTYDLKSLLKFAKKNPFGK